MKPYRIRTPENYPEFEDCYEVVWNDIFVPFDVICGLDGCPPDNNDCVNDKKTHWWVCPQTKSSKWNVQDISTFIQNIPVKEFEKLEDAIEFCLNWRKQWLNTELEKWK